jgi:hypothetical protein
MSTCQNGKDQFAPDFIYRRRGYSKEEIDFFICCGLDVKRFWIVPFADTTVLTLKIYNGDNGSKFHKYEDAWILLEK